MVIIEGVPILGSSGFVLKPHFFNLYFTISNGFVTSKIYDICDDFDSDIVFFFPFFFGFRWGRSPFYFLRGSHFTTYSILARVSSHVTDFNACNKIFTAELPQQSYRYHKPRKTI